MTPERYEKAGRLYHAALEKEPEARAAFLDYDLRSLRVSSLGPGRKSFGGSVVQLEPDVAEVFPDAESVNKDLAQQVQLNIDDLGP
jgi:hypothetical protein